MEIPVLFLFWIKALYNQPTANILYCNHYSDHFPIASGTQQGCPLSPILFLLVLEPLSILIQADSAIHGVWLGVNTFKINLCADDLLTLTLLIISLPNLFSALIQIL